MGRQATRNQILLAFLFCTFIITGLVVVIGLKGLVPDPVLTYLLVVLGDLASGIVLSKLLAEEKPQIEFSTTQDGERVGFLLITRRKSLHSPRVMLNGVKWELEEIGVHHNVEIALMYVDRLYAFYPFKMETTPGDKGWTFVKVTDLQGNDVMVGELQVDDTTLKPIRMNITTSVQSIAFNSDELEEQRNFDRGFILKDARKKKGAGVIEVAFAEPPNKRSWWRRLRL